ncbi:MAG: hypothetical protein CVT63_01880 [Candidatus Anoxymicrobium japonicum]|uniref:Uncharacterized protein n=1 Tax=Candidatus Anoxymicrobium japonicum TaxID=2013648 RepID=A0A2N3G7C9_9ACTN|nr:MAG: hypothetical protein CVT63_01880 [Candidatus Anoxymicrobium japonicum]
MVRRSNLELDDSLFEGEKRKSRGGRRRTPDEPKAPGSFVPTGRADNALAVSVVLAALLLMLLGFISGKENWFAVVFIGLMFLASELFALPMKSGGRLSVALLPLAMAMMISGPFGTAVVAFFGVPIFFMERGEHGARRVVFNTSQLVFAAAAAGMVFKYTGGGAGLDATLKNSGGLILPWILATIVFFVFNTLQVTPVLAPDGERMFHFWQRRLLPRLPGYAFYSVIGFLAAVVYIKLQPPAVVLLFAPILAVRVVYTRYGMMRDVCDSTTLAIVETIEDGNIFMEGHSLSVAEIAVAIADEMDFEEEDEHCLRQAALLHDMGKLALDPSIVDKADILSPDEYDEMKKHPLIAANIVSKEQSFAVVESIIRHHHEMSDGSGYPDGLAGDMIPPGARILAVADAFDAMQRPVPFRESLSAHDAVSEIARGKGMQFDPDAVDAFLKVAIKRGFWSGAIKDPAPMSAREPEQLRLTVEPGQLIGEEAAPLARDTDAAWQKPVGATSSGDVSYDDVREDIEKDIREWKRIESGHRRVREQKKKTRSRKKKKQEVEGEDPETS